jgi:subtilase family serine protease
MSSRARITGWAGLTLAAAAALTLAAAAAPAAASGRGTPRAPSSGPVTFRHACPAPSGHTMSCLALIDSTAAGRPLTRVQATADGLAPYLAADLQSAYKLPSALLGEGQTIAIVDAYDDPNAETDLAVYRAANSLPACTTANGCFEKVNQTGQQGNYPPADAGWAVEESLDLDMASAICPNCKLVLVEANDADQTGPNLETAENEAATLGANVISNSWGSSEYTGETTDCASYFSHPGVAITVGSGDSGFGAAYPATCAGVTAVGGTTLYHNNSKRGWGETAWSGTGSGCSAFIPKPAWQHDRLCGMRTDNDTAAVANPVTPVAIYDSYGEDGWIAVGGTSVAAPLIAGVYALAGNTATIGPGASWIYAHHQHLYDVTSGSNATAGSGCGGSYLCTAKKGYDGPTGWGTPHGIGAF